MTEQTDAAEARDPYLPDLDDETNLGLLIFEDATPGGTTKIIARILASDWFAAREAAARAEERERVAVAIEAERTVAFAVEDGKGWSHAITRAARIARSGVES